MTYRFCNLFRKVLKLFVQLLPPLALVLLEFDFILISVPVLALAISGFIELYVGGFTIELDILDV